MRATDIIARKRDGLTLSENEIRWFVSAFARGDLPDYQASALLMAIYLRGMTTQETIHLTLAMRDSGERLSLHDILPVAVDKHSTGGVGDKTTLALCPIVASLGLPVAKMSGRGLGFSGGTLDKLESIPGFRATLTTEEFRRQAREVGLIVAGQTAELAPADGQLYALRDVTATVDSLPLIASSIMSKKLAAGTDAILLDVKVGRGAFMKDLAQAEELARLMVDIGKSEGKTMTAILTAMDQPLGLAVGNALELREAIETLAGEGPADFHELVVTLAGHMLFMGQRAPSPEEGRQRAAEAIQDRSALARMREWVAAQGGDTRVIDEPARLPQAPFIHTLSSPREGYLALIDAQAVGMTSLALGAGREKKNDPVDHAVGIVLHAKAPQFLRAGQPLMTVHARREDQITQAERDLLAACSWSDEPIPEPALIFKVIP